jgi:uncharacterized protein
LDRVVVALSGGVDSSYLAAECAQVLVPDKVVAVTVDSPLLPREELDTAIEIAGSIGVRHKVVSIDELEVPEIATNPPDRCYWCKRFRFEALAKLADESLGGGIVLHGENADDHLDYRPGTRAARELGIRAPLAEAGLTKADVRVAARALGLVTWDRPSAACLASRFPYGTQLTREGLLRVERAEALLREMLALEQLRVRDHYPVARIEVAPADIALLAEADTRAQVTQALHGLGYRYVTVDLDGYRMGSLNEELVGKQGTRP